MHTYERPDDGKERHHFLLVAYPIQSHINPSLQLAKTLTRRGVRVTFSTAVSAHRRMFASPLPVDDPSDPLLSYHPYSDGYDDGYSREKMHPDDILSSFKTVGADSLHAVATTAGRPPVTCIVYAMLFPWLVAVAARIGVPSVLYWIQPAALYAVYHHYFHGYADPIAALSDDPSSTIDLPGLPPLSSGDLPSFLVGGIGPKDWITHFVVPLFEDVFSPGEGKKKRPVMVNTFAALESEVIEAMREEVEIIPIGPVLPEKGKVERKLHVVKAEMEELCIQWLDRWPPASVVYVSFGSISEMGRAQRAELACGLVEGRRPFLWVTRGERDGAEAAEEAEEGMVVGWCDQVAVLAHRAVGCFVTHHGWNSTLEGIACGVPMVGIPQWSDQPTNTKLVGLWGVGVRAEVDGGAGVVRAEELKRCVDVAMEDGEIRRRAKMWEEKAREAVGEGGPSDRNLRDFISNIRFGH